MKRAVQEGLPVESVEKPAILDGLLDLKQSHRENHAKETLRNIGADTPVHTSRVSDSDSTLADNELKRRREYKNAHQNWKRGVKRAEQKGLPAESVRKPAILDELIELKRKYPENYSESERRRKSIDDFIRHSKHADGVIPVSGSRSEDQASSNPAGNVVVTGNGSPYRLDVSERKSDSSSSACSDERSDSSTSADSDWEYRG